MGWEEKKTKSKHSLTAICTDSSNRLLKESWALTLNHSLWWMIIQKQKSCHNTHFIWELSLHHVLQTSVPQTQHPVSSLRKRHRQGTILDLEMSLNFWSILRIKGMLRGMGGPGMWSCLHGICPWQLLPSFLSPATTGTTWTSSSSLHSVKAEEKDFWEPEHRRCHSKPHRCPTL